MHSVIYRVLGNSIGQKEERPLNPVSCVT